MTTDFHDAMTTSQKRATYRGGAPIGASRPMRRTAGLIFAFGLALLLLPVELLSQSRSVPWHPKRGANRIADSTLTDPSSWHLEGGDFCEAGFDPTISRSKSASVEAFLASCSGANLIADSEGVTADGSIRMHPYDSSCSRRGMVSSIRLPVEPGRTYTFGGYMRASDWPSFIFMFVGMYDSNDRFTVNHFGSRQGTTAPGEWQEVMIPFTATDYEADVELYVRRNREEPTRGGCVWFDEPYLGDGVVFDNPPSTKRRFESEMIVVDSLGNFFLKQGQSKVPFFPVAVYGTSRRDNFEIYRAQGFNTVMRMDYPKGMQKAQDAGLFYSLDITRWMLDSHTPSEAVAKGRDLATTIENIYAHVGPNGKRLSDNLLMYYWDNETLGKDWEVVQTILQSVNDKDGDVSARSGASRSRQRPVYVLQGSYGVARSYDRLVDGSGAPMIDVVGTYVRSADDTKSPQLADALVALDKTPGQSVPGAFGQINDRGNVSLTAAELRLSVYNTLIAGGKAIGIFRDPYNGHDKDVGIEYSLWWDELPTLVEEIAELMPIIQEPHWTTWQVFANVDKLGIGTRNHDGHGYILVTNNNPYSVRATFRIEDNAGPARYVIDYFDNDVVATVSESQFEILLLANATRVLELTDTKRNVD